MYSTRLTYGFFFFVFRAAWTVEANLSPLNSTCSQPSSGVAQYATALSDAQQPFGLLGSGHRQVRRIKQSHLHKQ